MTNIVKFNIKRPVSRNQAIGYLIQNKILFPKNIDYGNDLFYGWRFIKGLDGIVYFADCISRGITEHEVYENLIMSV